MNEKTVGNENKKSNGARKMPEKHAPIVIVSGMGRNTRVIGKDNGLIWHVPEDLKRFKELTMGHPVIMGDKTFASIIDILGKPFPGRTNIIATLDPDYKCDWPEVKIAHSIEGAVRLAQEEEPAEIHIGGGGVMYKLYLPYAERLHLTFYDDNAEGDTYFPEFADQFEIVKKYSPQEYDGLKYQWVDFRRKK